MKIAHSLVFLGLLACNKNEDAARNAVQVKNQSANVEQTTDETDKDSDKKLESDDGDQRVESYVCPKQAELKALPFEANIRQFVFQRPGTNCNGLNYVQACPVVPFIEAASAKKGKSLKFAEVSALDISSAQGSSSKTSNAYFLEFKVLQDQTELSVAIADIKLSSPLSLTLMNREGIESLSYANIQVADASKKIDQSLFEKKIVLPVGSYSFVLRSDKAEIAAVTITANQDIEDLGVVRAKGSNGNGYCN
ncbi:MAG: hypothetical protein EOP07_21440 [Proteobacteria bacterium]|nr:MAG: hypothetical protein EOP07_21440 [Pseudomonadota bacterium]